MRLALSKQFSLNEETHSACRWVRHCRHKMEHLNQACDEPMEVCMSFGNAANSLIKNDYAREIDSCEGLDILAKAYEHNLVQFGENVQQGISFLCNCCSCCCEAMIASRKFGLLDPVHTTNFLPQIQQKCIGCGKCIDVCPVGAIFFY